MVINNTTTYEHGGEDLVAITWTPEKLALFKQDHANMLAADKDSFVFDGHGFLTAYAGYLIQYLEGVFQCE